MRVSRAWLVVAVLLIPSASRADDHFADWFLGFSWAQASTLLGAHSSFAWTVPEPDWENLSVVGDFSAHFGSHDGDKVALLTYLVGPRWSVAGDRSPKWLPSGHALFGGVTLNGGRDEGTDFALALGGAWEHVPPAVRKEGGWSWRVQVDYVVRDGDNFPRASFGLVKRFP
jgi:hypothetical protein